MSENLVVNGNNSLAKGTVIYEKGQPLQSVGLILKGRVVLKGDGIRTTLGSGNFLGMYDAMQGKHSFTSIALDDCVIYGLPINGQKQACLLLDEKPQYRGLLVTSINFFLQDIARVYTKIKQAVDKAAEFVDDSYHEYLQISEQSGLVPDTISSLEELLADKKIKEALPEELNYFLQCCRIPVEAQKNYYGANAYVAKYYFQQQCSILPQILKMCRDVTEKLKRYFRVMVMDEKNLFSIVGHMALGVKRAGQNDGKLSRMLDQILEHINDTETILIENAGENMHLNRQRMEETYFALLSDDTGSLEEFEQTDMQVLDHSLEQILDYAPIHGRLSEEFAEAVGELEQLADPFMKTPEAGALRKRITQMFFEIYEAVVMKSFEDAKPPMAVYLFLRYGYISEHFLKEEELQILLTLPDSREEQMSCRVYTLAEWLREIYEGRKNPCKNEFDMDYEEVMRKQLQGGELAQNEYQEALEDGEQKVHFEVDNLVRYADRLLNGNISAFLPILCSQGIFANLENSVVTAAAINQTVNKVEKIDYSIFYREYLVAFEEAGLTRFDVTARYTPEFILFPVYGRNGLMWQDLEGRNKKSHARILMPSFMEQDLSGTVLKMLAHYRWERCRTEMGAQWNNYRYASLTSEYVDYLQFYKKNNNLSAERKEKVKAQLQQCNNKYREVFTRDYQDWILREVTGAPRLNRVAREILYTYCPFSQKYGKDLLEQTAYREAAGRYIRERGKRQKALVAAVHKFEKAGMDLPEEVAQTKRLVLEE